MEKLARDLGRVMSLGDLSTKAMLVCAKACGGAEKLLRGAGYEVAKVNSGQKAVHRVQRETFDVAIIISTGKSMDLTETVLNLRDLDESMHIAIIAAQGELKVKPVVPELLSRRCARTQSLKFSELKEYLGWLTRLK